jgi:hypothetical protein
VSREARLIVVLLVIAAIGVSGLMLVANQYRKALGPALGMNDAPLRALFLVDGFIAARTAEKAAAAPDFKTIRRLNAEALAAHGLTVEDYATVRAAWRAFKQGNPVPDPGLAAAFETRRAALDESELGAIETLDDGIK